MFPRGGTSRSWGVAPGTAFDDIDGLEHLGLADALHRDRPATLPRTKQVVDGGRGR